MTTNQVNDPLLDLLDEVKREAKTIIKPKVFYRSDGHTTIAEAMAMVEKHITNEADRWEGTQKEYDEWAIRRMERFLEHITIK